MRATGCVCQTLELETEVEIRLRAASRSSGAIKAVSGLVDVQTL